MGLSAQSAYSFIHYDNIMGQYDNYDVKTPMTLHTLVWITLLMKRTILIKKMWIGVLITTCFNKAIRDGSPAAPPGGLGHSPTF